MSTLCRVFLQTVAISVLICPSAFAQDKAQRVVSLNLCTDQLVLMLADKANIASITYLATNSDFSHMAKLSNGIHLNRGQAEQIIPLNPDLILNSQFSATATSNLLKRLGFEVNTLSFPETLADTYAQIRQVADLLGQSQRGEELIFQMQRDIELSLSLLPTSKGEKLAVFYSSNGYTYGANTLRDDFLTLTGLRNLAAEAGITGSGLLPLELLLAAKPDYLLVNAENIDSGNLAHQLLKHPALLKLFDRNHIIELPDNLFQCAGPLLVDAFRIMTEYLSSGRNTGLSTND